MPSSLSQLSKLRSLLESNLDPNNSLMENVGAVTGHPEDRRILIVYLKVPRSEIYQKLAAITAYEFRQCFTFEFFPGFPPEKYKEFNSILSYFESWKNQNP